MCGICGYIGASKAPEVTYDLMTHLFDKTEVRGEDAAGIWGAVGDEQVLYHKEPIKSSQFVRGSMWQRVGKDNPDLLICHARQASMGVGIPSINKNNHPFLSTDGRIGLIHNGRIPDVEYNALKKRFPTASTCDSEILMRIFEAGKFAEETTLEEFGTFDRDIAERLVGMKHIWSFLSLGHMAVAIGETKPNTRRLWLFRNKHRTLWLADMRTTLGQVFFFSTPQIWRGAVDAYERVNPDFKQFTAGGVKLIDLPPEEIWMFHRTPEVAIPDRKSLKRFSIISSGTFHAWKEDQLAAIPIADRGERIQVVTELELDNEERVKERPVKRMGFQTQSNFAGYRPETHHTTNVGLLPGAVQQPHNVNINAAGKADSKVDTMTYPLTADDANVQDIETICSGLEELTKQIRTVFNTRLLAGQVEQSDFNALKASLEAIELDMTGTMAILDRT